MQIKEKMTNGKIILTEDEDRLWVISCRLAVVGLIVQQTTVNGQLPACLLFQTHQHTDTYASQVLKN